VLTARYHTPLNDMSSLVQNTVAHWAKMGPLETHTGQICSHYLWVARWRYRMLATVIL